MVYLSRMIPWEMVNQDILLNMVFWGVTHKHCGLLLHPTLQFFVKISLIIKLFMILFDFFVNVATGQCSLNSPLYVIPTAKPTAISNIPGPSRSPTRTSMRTPTRNPTRTPTRIPTRTPTRIPTRIPTCQPTQNLEPTKAPQSLTVPTQIPTRTPSVAPTATPSAVPSVNPTVSPSVSPTVSPSTVPSVVPSTTPTFAPSRVPSAVPSTVPTQITTRTPSVAPTASQSAVPTANPTASASTTRFLLGGWIGDDDWDTVLPYPMSLDYLDLGYITCIQTLQNGPCEAPGPRQVINGPPPALAKAATNLLYVLGGDKCNAAGWDAMNQVTLNSAWHGIDIDNECRMTPAMISSTLQALQRVNKISVVDYLCDPVSDLTWLSKLSPAPTFYASLTFWGSEFCSMDPAKRVSRCVPSNGGYEVHIPNVIRRTLQVIGTANSRKMILGLHAVGINAATVAFWCAQVQQNNLGGVFVTFLHKLDQTLYRQLSACLGRE